MRLNVQALLFLAWNDVHIERAQGPFKWAWRLFEQAWGPFERRASRVCDLRFEPILFERAFEWARPIWSLNFSGFLPLQNALWTLDTTWIRKRWWNGWWCNRCRQTLQESSLIPGRIQVRTNSADENWPNSSRNSITFFHWSEWTNQTKPNYWIIMSHSPNGGIKHL